MEGGYIVFLRWIMLEIVELGVFVNLFLRPDPVTTLGDKVEFPGTFAESVQLFRSPIEDVVAFAFRCFTEQERRDVVAI
jgi:hypothetical protein